MPTVIKATDAQRGVERAVAFNFEDLTRQAQAYLDQVRAQGEQLLAQARKEAEAIRRAAEAEGRAAGEQAVGQFVEKELGRQMETLWPALRQAIAGIEEQKQAWLLHWEQEAVHLAAAIAARILRRERVKTPEVTLVLVKEALELAAGSPEVSLHLNPADYDALGAEVNRLAEEISRLAPARVIADPTITPGGCRVETRHGVIDQQFEAQLARIEEELK